MGARMNALIWLHLALAAWHTQIALALVRVNTGRRVSHQIPPRHQDVPLAAPSTAEHADAYVRSIR